MSIKILDFIIIDKAVCDLNCSMFIAKTNTGVISSLANKLEEKLASVVRLLNSPYH
jgi:hypothetical protein